MQHQPTGTDEKNKENARRGKEREDKNKRPHVWKPYLKLIGNAKGNNKEYHAKHKMQKEKENNKNN